MPQTKKKWKKDVTLLISLSLSQGDRQPTQASVTWDTLSLKVLTLRDVQDFSLTNTPQRNVKATQPRFKTDKRRQAGSVRIPTPTCRSVSGKRTDHIKDGTGCIGATLFSDCHSSSNKLSAVNEDHSIIFPCES